MFFITWFASHSLQIHCVGLIGPRPHIIWAWTANRDPTIIIIIIIIIFPSFTPYVMWRYEYIKIIIIFHFKWNFISQFLRNLIILLHIFKKKKIKRVLLFIIIILLNYYIFWYLDISFIIIIGFDKILLTLNNKIKLKY